MGRRTATPVAPDCADSANCNAAAQAAADSKMTMPSTPASAHASASKLVTPTSNNTATGPLILSNTPSSTARTVPAWPPRMHHNAATARLQQNDAGVITSSAAPSCIGQRATSGSSGTVHSAIAQNSAVIASGNRARVALALRRSSSKRSSKLPAPHATINGSNAPASLLVSCATR